MIDNNQTFIEVNRFFKEKDDLKVVESADSIDGIDAYPGPTDENLVAINVQQDDYYLTIELSEDVVEKAHNRLKDETSDE